MKYSVYEIDGAFGKVRLGNFVFSSNAQESLMCFTGIGWHKCNDLYGIYRKEGYSYPLILFTVDGMGVLRMGNREYSLTAGSVAVIGEDIPHEYFTPHGGEWEFYWAHPEGMASKLLLNYFFSVRDECVFISSDIYRYTEGIEKLMDYIENGKTLSERTVCAMFSDIMYWLVSDTGDEKSAPSRLSDEVIRYLEKHYSEDISIEKLSCEFYISSAHLIRRFKYESGYTPYEYLGLIRITKACRLLEFTDMPISEVAVSVGMNHVSRFITKFKSIVGVTPAAYRKQRESEKIKL